MNDTQKEQINEILEQIREESFVKGYNPTKEEVMGLLISKYFQYDGLAILKTTYNALEDVNFHGENKEIAKMINRLETN